MFFLLSCDLDLSNYEKERTHEIWHELDHGYGAIHISLTMCDIKSHGNEESDNCFNRHVSLYIYEQSKYFFFFYECPYNY